MEDFLNKDQAKQLQEKSWIVKPKGFYITIYPEDMAAQAGSKFVSRQELHQMLRSLPFWHLDSRILINFFTGGNSSCDF